MKKLILKVCLFITLILCVTHGVISNVNIAKFKNYDPCGINYINNNSEQFNVFFVGSSRFGRQIDPELFDSLNVSNGYRSYNFSFDAAFAPTSVNMANHILDLASDSLELLVLELAPIEFIGGLYQGHVQRTIGWYELADFAFLFQSGGEKCLSRTDQLITYKDWTYLFCYRLFSIGEFWKRVPQISNNCESNKRQPKPTPKEELTESLIQELDEVRLSNETSSLANYGLNLQYSSYARRLNSLEIRCKERGIELLYVITPRRVSFDIHFIQSLSNILDPSKVIRLNDSNLHSKLYSIELTGDLRHLGENGIDLFTKLLNSEIVKHRKEKINDANATSISHLTTINK